MAHVQKSWMNHAIQKVEAPGVECDRNQCKEKENGPNGRPAVVTRSGQKGSQPISWGEFVTAVSRAKMQIGKARKVLEAGDKALTDEMMAKVERSLERVARRIQKASG